MTTGEPAFARPPVADDVDAIATRETEIDDRGVHVAGQAGKQASLAVRRNLDTKADRREPLPQALTQRGVIFDHEDAHGFRLLLPMNGWNSLSGRI